MAREPGSSGFTLIELVVVIGVIGILAGLILSGVQSARESARRLQCVANLRQIGIAMGSYESIHRMFPTSPLFGPFTAGLMISQQAYLLPYLEQGPLFSSVNTQFGLADTGDTPSIENRTARNTRLAIFLCPSDAVSACLNTYRFNRGRYGAIPGVYEDGPFGTRLQPRPGSITDGLSQTAFASERIGGSFTASAGPPRDVKLWNGPPGYYFGSDLAFIPLCVAAEPPYEWMTTTGRYWMYGGLADTQYNHNGAPNDLRPSCSAGTGRIVFEGLEPPRSFHPGIVNVLMGDGRAIVVTNSISPQVWTAMGTANAQDVW